MYAHSYQNIFLQAFSIEMNWNAKRFMFGSADVLHSYTGFLLQLSKAWQL